MNVFNLILHFELNMIKKYILLVMMLLCMTTTASAQEIRGEAVEAAIINKIESVNVAANIMKVLIESTYPIFEEKFFCNIGA